MKKSLIACSLLALGMTGEASALAVYGVTTTGSLVVFDSSTPGTISNTVAISGLVGGDTITGIDFRPATGQLFAEGSGSRIYTINTTTGMASQVGASGQFSLVGTSFGFDFNPVPDRIRATSNADQDLRLNPNTGGLAATDGTLTYALGDVNAGVNPNIVGNAYTNSSSGIVTATTLYDIDSNLDTLVIQNPPNSGTLNTVGSLGVNTTDQVGFDIFFFGNLAFASLTALSGISSLYSINLATGAASLIGGIGSGLSITGIAIQQVPEPVTFALFGFGLAGLAFARKKSGLKA